MIWRRCVNKFQNGNVDKSQCNLNSEMLDENGVQMLLRNGGLLRYNYGKVKWGSWWWMESNEDVVGWGVIFSEVSVLYVFATDMFLNRGGRSRTCMDTTLRWAHKLHTFIKEHTSVLRQKMMSALVKYLIFWSVVSFGKISSVAQACLSPWDEGNQRITVFYVSYTCAYTVHVFSTSSHRHVCLCIAHWHDVFSSSAH